MAISRKPKAAPASPAVDVEALINKGGSIARMEGEPAPEAGARVEPMTLRLPADVKDRVDRLAAARRVRTPRHSWIMEAVYEKLEREEKISS